MIHQRLSRRAFTASAAALSATVLAGSCRPGLVNAASPVWEQIAPGTPGPAARWDHTLAADDTGRQLLVFGGRDVNFAALNDTWLFDIKARTWTQVEGDGPAPRFGQAIATDQKTRRLSLFGGQNQDQFFNDTWQFDFETADWTQLDAGDTIAPSPRYGLPGVLDGRGHLIVSHGFTFEGRFNDTWSFDLDAKSWTDISPSGDGIRPLNRCLHELVWDTAAKRMLLYGGCSSGFGPCPQGDLWSFDPGSQSWTELTPADGPASRSNPALVWDRSGHQTWLFGGLTDAGYSADLWSGTPTDNAFTWTPIDTSGPSPRASHDAVLTGGRLYIFGGTGDSGPQSDLWRLSFPK